MASRIDVFKRVAFENITKKIDTYEQFEEAVCNWWRRKYKLADTDTRYLSKRADDIVVEYFEDQFRESPQLLAAYSMGFDSIEDMEEKRVKEIMGDEYTDEVVYFEKPTTAEKKGAQPQVTTQEEEEVETILEF